jgi:hypothetical protein
VRHLKELDGTSHVTEAMANGVQHIWTLTFLVPVEATGTPYSVKRH